MEEPEATELSCPHDAANERGSWAMGEYVDYNDDVQLIKEAILHG